MTSSKLPIYGAIAANLAIAVAKFVAAGITGSSAMISEGIHSLVDTGNGFLLLLGIKRSKIAPDSRHPFGHGKEVYFWALIVAILIFSIGGGISFYEGFIHIKHPQPLSDPTWSYVVLGLALIFEGAVLIIAIKKFPKLRKGQSFWQGIKSSKDPAAFAVIFEDVAALLGVFIALAGIYLGHQFNNPYFDGAASIAIGIVLALVAVLLAYESKGLLIGEGAAPHILKSINQLVLSDTAIERADLPLTMHLGPTEVVLALELKFKEGMTTLEIEKSIIRIESAIQKEHPEIKKIFIEAKSF